MRGFVGGMTVEVLALVAVLAFARTATLPSDPQRPPPKVMVVGHGQEVRLDEYAVRGRTTIFKFYSEYCPSCRRVAKPIEDLVRADPYKYLRNVDVNRPGVTKMDFDSPTSRQFGIRALPYFVIVDEKGQIIDGEAAHRRMFELVNRVTL